MLNPSDRAAVVRAGRCFHSLGGQATVFAVTTLACIRRLQDAFIEHVAAVHKVRAGKPKPGIAMIWVPEPHRSSFGSVAAVKAACRDLEAENPSLESSLTTLWPSEASSDKEVAEAWKHLAGMRWSTRDLFRTQFLQPADEEGEPPTLVSLMDVIGEVYETLQLELKVKIGQRNGEFFTPTNVVRMMVEMTMPEPKLGQSILDPCCGSGRMLVEAAVKLIETHGRFTAETGANHPLGPGFLTVVPPPAILVGQDIAQHGPAMGRVSLTALGYTDAVFIVRDSLLEPATLEEVASIVAQRASRMEQLHARHLVDDALVAAVAQLVPAPPPPVVGQSTLGAFDTPVPTSS